MPNFSALENRLPPSNVVVPPEAWDSTWADRPDEDVCIGLRYVADGSLEDARVEAYRRAKALFPDHEKSEEVAELFSASFQDGLLRFVIARGTCDPNDVMKPWSGWEDAPEDIAVEQALSDRGAQLIFDAWERMRIGANIGLPAATDADLALLPELLLRLPLIGAESRTTELRLRRLLRFVLEALEEAGPLPPVLDPKAALNRSSAEESTVSPGAFEP